LLEFVKEACKLYILTKIGFAIQIKFMTLTKHFQIFCLDHRGSGR